MSTIKKILIVDDHQLFQEGLQQLLILAFPQAELLLAKSGAEALDVVDQHPDVDLMLLDIMLPDMDGLELILALTGKNVQTPVVIISAHQNMNLIRLALNNGALGYIPKSSSSDEMVQAIGSVIAGNIYLPHDIQMQLMGVDKTDLSIPVVVKSRLTKLNLSERQYEVLVLVAMGYKNAKIAEMLKVTEATIKAHVSALLKQISAKNRTECVLNAKRMGLLPHLEI